MATTVHLHANVPFAGHHFMSAGLLPTKACGIRSVFVGLCLWVHTGCVFDVKARAPTRRTLPKLSSWQYKHKWRGARRQEGPKAAAGTCFRRGFPGRSRFCHEMGTRRLPRRKKNLPGRCTRLKRMIAGHDDMLDHIDRAHELTTGKTEAWSRQ